jgi:hypothetical protein
MRTRIENTFYTTSYKPIHIGDKVLNKNSTPYIYEASIADADDLGHVVVKETPAAPKVESPDQSAAEDHLDYLESKW